MANQIASINIDTDFSVQRVSKAGKVTERGVIGVLTGGTKDERGALAEFVMAGVIRNSSNNTFGPIVRELVRVFPASSLKAPKAKKGEATPKMKAGDVFEVNGTAFIATSESEFSIFNPAAVDAASVEALCRAIAAKCAGKEMKGEKAIYLQAARAVIYHLECKAAEKAAAQAAKAETEAA